MSALTETYRWLDDDGPAFGGPGLEPRWTSSKKDAVAMAYADSRRTWCFRQRSSISSRRALMKDCIGRSPHR